MVRTITGSVLVLILVAAPCRACNIPVFRYALERWHPDSYDAMVIHRGPMTPQQLAQVESLRQIGGQANFSVSTHDLFKSSAEVQENLVETYHMTQFPWLIVRYPESADPENPAYSGPLNLAAIRKLVDSPARRELARRLLGGESVVWVYLESGREMEDEIVLARLKGALARLEKSLKLPELSDSPKDKLLREQLPLKISFSILRLSHSDPAEKSFVHLLQNLERGLRKSDPMVFPVFGRGLVLYGIVGRGITDTDENIEQAATFLTSKCSCEVKRLNPGVDMLMTADWDGSLPDFFAAPRESAPITLVRREVPGVRSAADMVFQQSPTIAAPADSSVLRGISFVFSCAFVLAALATWAIPTRKASRAP